MDKIFILSGEVKSGKTSKLMLWAASQKLITGIFQPVIEDKRYIYNIDSKTLKPLETNDKDNSVLIGNYRFSNSTFDWAKDCLVNSLERKFNWLVIDEIGPLELQGKGLEPVVSKIFSHQEQLEGNILLIVRSALFEKFIKHYQLENKYELFEF
jgi:nucleoside-triphosphatase THEP1